MLFWKLFFHWISCRSWHDWNCSNSENPVFNSAFKFFLIMLFLLTVLFKRCIVLFWLDCFSYQHKVTASLPNQTFGTPGSSWCNTCLTWHKMFVCHFQALNCQPPIRTTPTGTLFAAPASLRECAVNIQVSGPPHEGKSAGNMPALRASSIRPKRWALTSMLRAAGINLTTSFMCTGWWIQTGASWPIVQCSPMSLQILACFPSLTH